MSRRGERTAAAVRQTTPITHHIRLLTGAGRGTVCTIFSRTGCVVESPVRAGLPQSRRAGGCVSVRSPLHQPVPSQFRDGTCAPVEPPAARTDRTSGGRRSQLGQRPPQPVLDPHIPTTCAHLVRVLLGLDVPLGATPNQSRRVRPTVSAPCSIIDRVRDASAWLFPFPTCLFRSITSPM